MLFTFENMEGFNKKLSLKYLYYLNLENKNRILTLLLLSFTM